jgi:hypothetical protein
MRFVRLLAVVIILYGLSYLQYALLQLYTVIQRGGFSQIPFYALATNINIGLVTFVIGIGVLLAREWARILWLLTSIVLVATHVFLLWLVRENEQPTTQQLLNVLLILILLLISWTKLTRPAVKELFS